MDYQEAIDGMHKIKEGMDKEAVLAIMGKPDKEDTDEFIYDFEKCGGFPKLAPGVQLFYGISVKFKQGIVSFVSKDWADME